MQYGNVKMLVDDYSHNQIVSARIKRWGVLPRTNITNRRNGPPSLINIVGYLGTKFRLPLRQGCMLPFHQLAIKWDGKLIRCCMDWNSEGVYGDLLFDSIANVRDRMKQLKQDLRKHLRTGMCVRCDDVGVV